MQQTTESQKMKENIISLSNPHMVNRHWASSIDSLTLPEVMLKNLLHYHNLIKEEDAKIAELEAEIQKNNEVVTTNEAKIIQLDEEVRQKQKELDSRPSNKQLTILQFIDIYRYLARRRIDIDLQSDYMFFHACLRSKNQNKHDHITMRTFKYSTVDKFQEKKAIICQYLIMLYNVATIAFTAYSLASLYRRPLPRSFKIAYTALTSINILKKMINVVRFKKFIKILDGKKKLPKSFAISYSTASDLSDFIGAAKTLLSIEKKEIIAGACKFLPMLYTKTSHLLPAQYLFLAKMAVSAAQLMPLAAHAICASKLLASLNLKSVITYKIHSLLCEDPINCSLASMQRRINRSQLA